MALPFPFFCVSKGANTDSWGKFANDVCPAFSDLLQLLAEASETDDDKAFVRQSEVPDRLTVASRIAT